MCTRTAASSDIAVAARVLHANRDMHASHAAVVTLRVHACRGMCVPSHARSRGSTRATLVHGAQHGSAAQRASPRCHLHYAHSLPMMQANHFTAGQSLFQSRARRDRWLSPSLPASTRCDTTRRRRSTATLSPNTDTKVRSTRRARPSSPRGTRAPTAAPHNGRRAGSVFRRAAISLHRALHCLSHRSPIHSGTCLRAHRRLSMGRTGGSISRPCGVPAARGGSTPAQQVPSTGMALRSGPFERSTRGYSRRDVASGRTRPAC